jgi:hypothetical protein
MLHISNKENKREQQLIEKVMHKKAITLEFSRNYTNSISHCNKILVHVQKTELQSHIL